MSIHPNAILLLALTPHDLARKTMKAILAEFCPGRLPDSVEEEEEPDILIGEDQYHTHIMEDSYYESMQIAAKEGDLIFFDLVTYGYGENIAWEKLEAQKIRLEAWAKDVCVKYHCDSEIFVTANFW